MVPNYAFVSPAITRGLEIGVSGHRIKAIGGFKAMQLMVEVSIGELLDKITILRIKRDKINDPVKLANVLNELNSLETVVATSVTMTPEIACFVQELQGINEELWDIEDDIRECERQKDFGERFVALARAVYFTNDRRAEAKREINRLAGSRLVEEKSYAAY